MYLEKEAGGQPKEEVPLKIETAGRGNIVAAPGWFSNNFQTLHSGSSAQIRSGGASAARAAGMPNYLLGESPEARAATELIRPPTLLRENVLVSGSSVIQKQEKEDKNNDCPKSNIIRSRSQSHGKSPP
jgi:hypothetical protein